MRRADEESFALYSHLAGSFRSGALAELLGNTIRLLLLALGKEALQEFINGYIASTPPSAFPTDEVIQFRRFLEANPFLSRASTTCWPSKPRSSKPPPTI